VKTTLDRAALELLGLPASARAILADRLLANLESDEPSGEIEKAWKREALKPCRAFDEGKLTERNAAESLQDAYQRG
jgi:hypothetical protein